MTTEAELKTTPLNQWHHDHGGQMVPFGGWDMPVQYETKIVAEHLATRRAAGLFDVSHMGRFVIHGRDKIAFLQHALTNNCLALEPGQAQYTIIPDQEGHAIDDAFLYRPDEEQHLLVVNAANADKDWDHLTALAGEFDDASLEDITESTALIALQGPAAKEILAGLMTSGALPEPQQGWLAPAELGGIAVTISRTGYTGEPNSFELFVAADRSVELWEMLMERGGPLGLTPVGLGARDTLRLEAGMPLYGHELGQDPADQPIPIFAIGLAPVAVSFSPLKGDFVGREALAAQAAERKRQRKGLVTPHGPLPRVIRPLALTQRGVARREAKVFLGEREVGVITSGTSAPYWEFQGEGADMRITDQHALRPLALAYVDADLLPEVDVEVEVRKKRLSARIVASHGRSEAPPFFHPLPVGWARDEYEAAQAAGMAQMEFLVNKALDNHQRRQDRCINLIPSEQSLSPLVRLLSVSDPVGRYAEHRSLRAAMDREIFFYQGTDFIAQAEEMLAAQMREYLGCPEVELRPISGQTANMAVFSAMVSWKNLGAPKAEPARLSLVLNHHLGKGGHLSAQPLGGLRDCLAKDDQSERFAALNFPVLADNPFQVDLEATAQLLEEYHPELIILGRSMTLHKEPVAQVAAMIADMKPRPILMHDMAHTLGLLGPVFQSPLAEGADILTASTHKTFFGTQRGVIGGMFSDDDPVRWELWQTINSRSFPGMTSNHHLGTLLGLLAASLEMNAFKREYQPQVLANAKALAKALADAGVKVCGDAAMGYTETHQVVMDVGYAQGMDAAGRLEENGIIVNYQALPWDEGFTASSGLRTGVQEMTRFGMKEAEMAQVGGLMAEVLLQGKDVKEAVAKLRAGFTRMRFCFDGPELDALKGRLLATF